MSNVSPPKPAVPQSVLGKLWQQINLVGLIKETIITSTRLLPDAVFYSTLFFSLVTMNYTLTVIAIFLLCVVGVRGLLGIGFKNIVPLEIGTLSGDCIPGFDTEAGRTTIAGRTTFPSPIIFPAAALAAYCMSAVISVSDSLDKLGSDYAAKPFFSVALSAVLLAVIITTQVKLECATFKGALGSAAIGLLIGFVGYLLANHIFGDEGTNILGIPLLKHNSATGQPIYICGPTASGSDSV
jgi:hypothetical protein